jgi:hypothetical protein
MPKELIEYRHLLSVDEQDAARKGPKSLEMATF